MKIISEIEIVNLLSKAVVNMPTFAEEPGRFCNGWMACIQWLVKEVEDDNTKTESTEKTDER